MPDMNQKLERFRQLVLEDAQKERGKIMDDVDRQRRQRLDTARTEIHRRVKAGEGRSHSCGNGPGNLPPDDGG